MENAKALDSAMIQLDPGILKFLWVGIGIYIAVVLLIGLFCGRKVRDMGDFLVAGRRLPLWMATATLLATWFGAGSSMGVAATVYSGSLRDVIADPFAASISLILAGFLIVGVLRKLKCMTVTDIIQRRFGTAAGVYTSIWLLPVYIGWLGAQVLGIGTLLNLLTGVDMFWAQIIGAAVVLIYTVTGGMWAVTLTDVVQVSLIVVGLFVILPGAVTEAGGVSAILSNPDVDLSLLPAKDSMNTFSGWVNYAGNWMIMGLGCMVGQDLIQRSLASKDEKTAKLSSVISGFLYMLIAIVPIMIGLAAKTVLPSWGITEAVMGGDLENQVLPRMAVGVLGMAHPVLLTLFLSALISAIMSSADSSLLAASSLFTNNILSPLCPKINDKNLLILTRIATVLLIVASTVLAMCVESIYSLMINCWASQLVIVFLPVVAAIYFPKATAKTVWACLIASTAVWIGYMFVIGSGIGGSFTDVMQSQDFSYYLTNGAVFGFLAGIAAFAVVYIMEQRKNTTTRT